MTELDKIWEKYKEAKTSNNYEEIISICRNGLEESRCQNNEKYKAWFSLSLADQLISYESSDTLAENIEEALHILKGLEENFRDNKSRLKFYGRIEHLMGEAYNNRLIGNIETNLKYAIEHLRISIDICKKSSSDDLAFVEKELADAYLSLSEIVGDEKYLDSSIEHLENARDIFLKTNQIEFLALVENAFAIIYKDKCTGDLSRNKELSIFHYQNALAHFDIIKDQLRWASAANALGVVFATRIKGEKRENLTKALSFFNDSLDIFRKLEASDDFTEDVTDDIKGVLANIDLTEQDLEDIKS